MQQHLPGAALLAPGQKLNNIQDGYQFKAKDGGVIKFYLTGTIHVTGKDPSRSRLLAITEGWSDVNTIPSRNKAETLGKEEKEAHVRCDRAQYHSRLILFIGVITKQIYKRSNIFESGAWNCALLEPRYANSR